MEGKYYLTGEDFDFFLEGIDLKSAYTLNPIKSYYFFDIYNGWYGLVKELITKLLEAGWDGILCQVKEKYGTLRFYIGSSNDEVFDLINEYELLSSSTCEVCGSKGEIISQSGWLKTSCKTCGTSP